MAGNGRSGREGKKGRSRQGGQGGLFMFHKEEAVSNHSSSKMKFVFIKICTLTFVTMKSIN